jgi:hypothetical protein
LRGSIKFAGTKYVFVIFSVDLRFAIPQTGLCSFHAIFKVVVVFGSMAAVRTRFAMVLNLKKLKDLL